MNHFMGFGSIEEIGIEVEFRNRHLEGVSVGGNHFVPARHSSGESFKDAEALVAMCSTWFDDGLLSNDAITFDDVVVATGVFDIPMPTDELNRFGAVIGDFYIVDENVFWFYHRGFFFDVDWFRLNDDIGANFQVSHRCRVKYGNRSKGAWGITLLK